MVERQGIGILTRTVTRSPVVQWILHARIRDKSLNDAIFVGDDFVHVRQILPGGHLEHITTKDDFDARIRAASVINIEDDLPDDNFLVKEEMGIDSCERYIPRDLLVLTLSTKDLVFLYLAADTNGQYSFVQQPCPLPAFDRMLLQPGEHVAVDPESRALAVAANEGEIVIYSIKSRSHVRQEIEQRDPTWCPVIAERALQVEGVIQCMEFLIPPDGDTSQIILLLIVIDDRKMKAICIDWHREDHDEPDQRQRDNSDSLSAQMHPALPLSTAGTVPSLLIPLRNASFLVVTGSEATWYKDIRSGSLTGALSMTLEGQPQQPGNSARRPIWTNWCRPARTPTARREKDHVYVVREDGLVSLLEATSYDTVSITVAGNLDCHVGTAFASLGRDADPDVLAVAGEMCSGYVVKIGHWPADGLSKVSDLGWADTMTMDIVEIITNWASATDMCMTKLPQSHGRALRARVAIFVTSGRQPYGSVTELRYGVEARLSLVGEPGALPAVTGVWALPFAETASYLILLTTPTSTICLDLDDGVIDTDALLTDQRTVMAASTTHQSILQVTEHGVCETTSLVANFEDTVKRPCKDGREILAAAIDLYNDRVLLVGSSDGRYDLSFMTLPLSDMQSLDGPSITLPSMPLAAACSALDTSTLAIVSTAEHGIIAHVIQQDQISRGHVLFAPTSMHEMSSLCDSVVILRPPSLAILLTLCGLRDGRLVSILFSVTEEGGIQVLGQHEIRVGSGSVQLTLTAENHSQAYMCVGTDMCLVSWDGSDSSHVDIVNIWLSDKNQPELPQGEVATCAQLPISDYLGDTTFGGSVIMVSDDQLLIGQITDEPHAVPRQLHLEGTPNRLLYCESQKSLVIASMKIGVRTFPAPNGRSEERRQIWPILDFIPARADESTYTYDMQPGERVYSLMEWSFKEIQDEKDKTYAFVVVGGSYVKSDGSQGGRVTFLQPSQSNREVTAVKEGKSTKFDAPVYALALYDELTYVVCYGRHVALYRFAPDSRKWSVITSPLLLAHPGIYVTVAAPLIYVSSLEDSLITLRFEPQYTDEQDEVNSRLIMVGGSPRADASLSHLIVDVDTETSVSLLTTKAGNIVGLACSSSTDTTPHGQVADSILFEASMPRSLTRIKEADIRPPWKAPPPAGILKDNIVGIASDGTLVGVALLGNKLWQRLSWLQRLCEWSPLLSPYSCHEPPYSVNDIGYARYERALPIGLAESIADNSELMLRTSIESPVDRHIDGDILNRLLEHGGEEVLERIINEAAQRQDSCGIWLRAHLQRELDAVPEIIRTLRVLLSGWL
ncbi:hypothetical protein LTR86_008920 [Recurvomyces mirabilis]|nr:hypothetical protein LTR86_008920 [Recurvomyces mirabilis]